MGEEKSNIGKLFVISGPSGVGKGTIIKELRKRNPSLAWSVSCTTRNPRDGEKDTVDYYFLDEQKFKQKMESGDFIEWAKVHDYYYGTTKEELERHIAIGETVLLEIDVQGANNIKNNNVPGTCIFLMPPSIDVLKERLQGRNSETEETFEKRMKTTKNELAQQDIYDYIIVNNELEDTLEKIEKIIEK
jgi:guanylate kinase